MKYVFGYTCLNGDGIGAYIKAEHEQVVYCPLCGAIMSLTTISNIKDNEFCYEIMFYKKEGSTC